MSTFGWNLGVVAAVTAIGAWVLVGAVRWYALRRGVLDRPNERSSHTVPTPRGGGLGAVIALLAAGVAAALHAGVRPDAVALVAGAVAAVALVGWLDDHGGLSVRARLAVHLAAGVAVSLCAAVARPAGDVLPTWAWAAWWVFWAISSINVVNFMDGIDGLIGSQLVLFGTYVATLGAAGSVARALGLLLAAASAGFLAWNWAPARIFLGDVGSGSLGLAAAVAGMAVVQRGEVSVVRAFLPLLPLFADAASTLVRRGLRGERVWSAHREHLYQRLANGPWSHAATSVAFGLAALAGFPVGLALRGTGFGIGCAVYAAGVAALGLHLHRYLARGGTPTPADSPAAAGDSPRGAAPNARAAAPERGPAATLD
jgi:UDP-N-acetylmuramyl pentapeptide phosphotransferase/UDP-N-acetylglucosamine-1-phosphate transferase